MALSSEDIFGNKAEAPKESKPEVKAAKAEIKQGVVNVEVPPATKFLRVSGFKGTYMGVVFDNDGISDIPVPDHVEKSLRAQFPAVEIEQV